MDKNPRISIKLESLLEFSARLNETYDEKFILNSMLLSLMGKLKILRACILQPVFMKPGPDDNKDAKPDEYIVTIHKGKNDLKHIEAFEIDGFSQIDNLAETGKKLIGAGYEYLLPVMYQEHLYAIVCLGKRIGDDGFSDDELQYARLVSTITANALNSAENHRSLVNAKTEMEKRNQLLTTLFEVGSDFSSLLSRNQILKTLSYRLMGQLMVSRFGVFLQDEAGQAERIVYRFDKILADEVLPELFKIKKTIRIDELAGSQELSGLLKEIGAVVLSPMIVQGNVRGTLIIGRKMNGEPFTGENLQFIEALGNTAITALENERLFHEELEKKRMEKEMELALDIQKKLLPKDVPETPGYDLIGFSMPSRVVGGDYFDYISLPGDNIMIAIADVSGKGVPASLLMANVQAALRALSTVSLSLTELVVRINSIVYHNTTPEKFITFFFGILDPNSNIFHYLNAGHNPPMFLRQNGEFDTLSEGGIILGISDKPLPYREGIVPIMKNEIIVFYTDGITEAMNNHHEEYGENRLQDVILRNRNLSSGDLLNTIVADVKAFADGAVQNDDITLVVLKSI